MNTSTSPDDRANAAQANTFNALPFFIGAVVIAHQLDALQARLHIVALLFVTLRMIYIAVYLAICQRCFRRSGLPRCC